MLRTSLTAHEIDDVLAATFPASDPPAWTSGMARPATGTRPAATGSGQDDDTRDAAEDVIDVSPARSERTLGQAAVSLMAVAGLALLVPFAVLAVAMPVALGVRGLLEIAEGVLSVLR